MRSPCLLLALLALCSVALAPVVAQDSVPELTMDYEAEFSEYGLDTEEVKLFISLKAVDEIDPDITIPIGVSAVVDTSSSMDSHRMDLLRGTLRFLGTEVAKNNNYMGLVKFSTKAEEVFQFQELNEASIGPLNDAIDNLDAEGRTALSLGLFRGLDQIGAAADTDTKCRTEEVFVFTDGKPNQGLTNSKKLLKKMNNLRENNVRVTTFPFGVGADFLLLEEVAANGDGEAYPISNLTDIGNAFAMAVSRLETTVAQNVKLTITPLPGTKIKTILDGHRRISKGQKETIVISNIAAQEQVNPFIILEVEPRPAGIHEILLVEASYQDTTNCKKTVSEELFVSIVRKENPDRSRNSTRVVENQCRANMGVVLQPGFGTLDKNGTQIAAAEMQDIGDEMRNITSESDGCCSDSVVLDQFVLGADLLAAMLNGSQSLGDADMAVMHQIGNAMLNGVNTIPSIDTDNFHLLQFFDTNNSKAARERANVHLFGQGTAPQD